MVQIEIKDPEKFLRALARLTVSDRGVQHPSDTTVYRMVRDLRRDVELAMIEEAKPKEEWRVIPGHKYFQINNSGIVRSGLTKEVVDFVAFKDMAHMVFIHNDQGTDVMPYVHDLMNAAFPELMKTDD